MRFPTAPTARLRPRSRSRSLLSAVALLMAALVLAPAAPAQARLALSSTPAASWRVNGTVYAEVILGDTLYVGGQFTTATSPGGTTAARANLAAFSMSTGELVTGWQADTNGRVRALATDGTSVFVGGAFRTVGGLARPYLAKLSADTGAVAAFNPKPNSGVRALLVADGRLYLGGTFATVTGQARPRVAAVDAGTGALASWAPAVNGAGVYALAVRPTTGVVYIGGSFSSVGSASRGSVAAIDPTTGEATATVFQYSVTPTLALATNSDGSLVYGGEGAGANSVYAWSAATGSRTWKVTADGDIQALLFYDGMVYTGFHDGYQGNTSTKLLAINPGTGAVGGFRPRFDQFYGVFALAASSAGLAAGGTFTACSGVAAQGFARFPSA